MMKTKELYKDDIIRVLMKTDKKTYVFMAALSAIAAWGAYVWLFIQNGEGLGVTGLNYENAWGLYIVNFAFFIGLSAGGVVIAGSVHLLNIRRLKTVAMIAELLAVSSLVVTMLSIVVDLGRPERFYYMIVYYFTRLESPLIWDFTVLNMYLLLSLSSIYIAARPQMARLISIIPNRGWLYKALTIGRTATLESIREKQALWLVALILIPVAVLVHSVTAWLFSLTKAQAGWFTSIMPPLFIGSALTSGTAMLIVTCWLVRRYMGIREISDNILKELGKLLLAFIPLDFYLLFSELFAHGYKHAQEGVGYAVLSDIIYGRFSHLFWTEMILGILVPLLLLLYVAIRPRTRIAIPTILISSIFIIIGVFIKRWDIVVPSQQHRLLEFYPLGFYTPTWVEISILIGILSVGVMTFTIMMKTIPVGVIKPFIKARGLKK